MATTTFATTAPKGTFWADLRTAWSQGLARRRLYNATLNELRDMTDRDLADIGLHRGLIHEVARQAAYGA